MKFKIGDKVALSKWYDCDENEFSDFNHGNLYIAGGIITRLVNTDKVKVKWDSKYTQDSFITDYKDSSEKLEVADDEIPVAFLIPLDNIKKLQSTLEKEYEAASKAIIPELKEAAKHIKEAVKIAEKNNMKLYDLPMRDLINALDEAGWRNSSFGC